MKQTYWDKASPESPDYTSEVYAQFKDGEYTLASKEVVDSLTAERGITREDAFKLYYLGSWECSEEEEKL